MVNRTCFLQSDQLLLGCSGEISKSMSDFRRICPCLAVWNQHCRINQSQPLSSIFAQENIICTNKAIRVLKFIFDLVIISQEWRRELMIKALYLTLHIIASKMIWIDPSIIFWIRWNQDCCFLSNKVPRLTNEHMGRLLIFFIFRQEFSPYLSSFISAFSKDKK